MNTDSCSRIVTFITKTLKNIDQNTLLTRTGRNDILIFKVLWNAHWEMCEC